MKEFKKVKPKKELYIRLNEKKFKKDMREFAQEWFGEDGCYKPKAKEEIDFDDFMDCATDIIFDNTTCDADSRDELDEDLTDELYNYTYDIGYSIYKEEKNNFLKSH